MKTNSCHRIPFQITAGEFSIHFWLWSCVTFTRSVFLLSCCHFKSFPCFFLGRTLGPDATWHRESDINRPRSSDLTNQVAFQLCWPLVWTQARTELARDCAFFSHDLWSIQVKAETGQVGSSGTVPGLGLLVCWQKDHLLLTPGSTDIALRICAHTLQAPCKEGLPPSLRTDAMFALNEGLKYRVGFGHMASGFTSGRLLLNLLKKRIRSISQESYEA